MSNFKMVTSLKTISFPEFFLELPKEVRDSIFEYNTEHRSIMKQVLNQLVDCIFCVNCGGIIEPSLLKHVNCCSSTCMYQLRDDPYAYYINGIRIN